MAFLQRQASSLKKIAARQPSKTGGTPLSPVQPARCCVINAGLLLSADELFGPPCKLATVISANLPENHCADVSPSRNHYACYTCTFGIFRWTRYHTLPLYSTRKVHQADCTSRYLPNS
jgi:hypothetical protein